MPPGLRELYSAISILYWRCRGSVVIDIDLEDELYNFNSLLVMPPVDTPGSRRRQGDFNSLLEMRA